MTTTSAASTGRERFAAVFRGEIPDRVPVTLFIQDQGHFLEQLYPDVDPWDSLTLQLKAVELQRDLGADIMARLLFGTLDPFQWMFFGGLDVTRSTDDAVGDDGWVGIWAPHGPFNMASLLIDEQELYALFYEDPDYYDRLMEVSLARVHDYTRAIDAPGVDILFIGGNVPGGFMGRANYERYVLPYEARHIAWAQQLGTPAAYHNCGQIQALVESYKGLGVAAVEPFSPPPKLGDADLALTKSLVGDAYVIIAGVDQIDVIGKGSVDDVRRATAETMRVGKPGGRFVLQNADFLEHGTPMRNVEAFVRTALEGARY